MTTAVKLISRLGAAGIQLWLDEQQQLRFRAPKGAMTEELKQSIIEHKADIISFMQQSQHSNDAITVLERRKDARYPLSFAQQRFWFLDKLQPGTATLHIPAVLKIEGQLHTAALQQAIDALSLRHEILRTIFVLDEEGEPQQQLLEQLHYPISQIDLSKLTGKEQQAALDAAIRAEALAPFAVISSKDSAENLLRLRIITLANHRAYLLLTLHHMIADGWSVQLLINELTQAYQAAVAGTLHIPCDLNVQYIDYSVWQHEQLDTERAQQQLTFWQQQLANVPILELPLDKPRPRSSDNNGASVHWPLPQPLMRAIQQLALTQKTSVFSVLFSAYATLLYRYSGQTDFCIGTPVAGRPLQAFENVLGCFINLLALRTAPDAELSFEQLLQQVSQSLLQAQENQLVPFEKVAELCADRKNPAHTPIFQVLFTHQHALAQTISLPDATLSIEKTASFSAKYDLQLHVNENSDLSSISLEYNRDIFTSDTIERFAKHYIALLDAIIAEPKKPLAQLQFVSADELNLLNKWNNTAFDYPACSALHHLIEQQVALTPNAIAVSDEQRTLTYNALNQAANQLAHELIQRGITAGKPVGVCLYRQVEMSIALLAILKAGGAYVPFDPDFPVERLQFMCEDTAISQLISHSDCVIAQQLQGPALLLVEQPNVYQQHSVENPNVLIDDGQCFNIIYTSGSTGKPKGVMVPHRGIINRLRWMQHQYPIDQHDKVLQKTPYSFDVSVWELFWPLMQGSQLVFAKPGGHKDPAYLTALITKENITTLHFVPSMLGVFLQTDNIEQCTSLRQVFASGEALQREHCRVFYQRLTQAKLHNLYGPTEASVDVSYYPCVADEKHRSVPIGKPIHNLSLYILDAGLNPVPPGIPGDLYIGGIGLALGYLNRDELNQLVFIQHAALGQRLYKTGDVARFLADGNIEYLGRSDFQVKIRGLRIELGEIESRLQKIAGIREAIVSCWSADNKAENTQLVAYLLANENIDTAAIRRELAQDLPDYMVPLYMVVLNEWPLSLNGKIDRKALPAPEIQINTNQLVAPTTELEQRLFALWQQQLSTAHFGIFDNFFELGGHSLSATRLVAQINKHCKTELSLAQFFDEPTIAAIAQIINQTADKTPVLPLLKAPRDQAIPLSYAQQRLWIIEQLNPGSSAYNIPLALKLSGVLDKDALKKALLAIIERHESLRTIIATDENGVAQQRLLASRDFVIEEIDARASHLNDTQLTAQFSDFAAQSFSFDASWLLRIRLIQIHDDQHALFVCMHHIISDGWSLSILQNELSALYQAFKYQHTAKLTVLNYQYADFAVWQQQLLQAPEQQQHLDYWLNQLAGIPDCINLPLDKPRPAQQTFVGAMITSDLPENISRSLRQFSQQQQVSLYSTLLTLYSIMLSKYAQQQDICIGTPVSGREHSELHALIGYFVNAVVIRCDVSGNPDFTQLSQRLHQTSREAFAHQDIPVETVLEKLPINRNLSYPPVAQVGFSFISDDLAKLPLLDGLDVAPIDNSSIAAKYDLTLIVIDHKDRLRLHFEFNSDLFKAETIALFAEHFNRLTQHALAQTDRGIETLSLFSSDEIASFIAVDQQKIETILPLSTMQKDMVMSQWLQPESLANTLGYRAEVATWVDEKLWRRACQITCDTEAVTRTIFAINPKPYGEFAWQCVLKQLDITLEVMDYRNESLSEEEINARVDAFIYRPEAYLSNHFIRYGLMRIRDDKTILLLSSHHALLDGVSIVLIAQKAARHFESLQQNTQLDASVYDSRVVADYVRNDLQQRDNHTTIAFWKHRFNQCDALDFPQAACTNSATQKIRTLDLSSELSQQIKQFAKQQRMTAAQLIKLVYGLMISHYCRAENDFYFSEFQAGRQRDNALALGCFFEQTPFIFPAAALTKESRLQDLFDYLRNFRKEIKAFDHLSLGMTRKLAPNGRLQFMFNYYHFFPQQQTMQGNAITCIEMPPFIGNTVQFIAKEHEHNLRFDLYYQGHVFNDLGFLQRLENVLQQLCDGCEVLAELNLLLPGETPLSGRRKTLPQGISHVQQLFEQQVVRSPNAIAIVDDHGEMDYQSLNQSANQLAHFLQQQGITVGTRVGICLPRQRDAMIAILAVIKAGAAYVPIDYNYPEQRIRHIVKEADITLLISHSTLKTPVDAINHTTLWLDEISLTAFSSDNLACGNNSRDALYVIFTSGSTGLPKGAELCHQGEINLLQWYINDSAFDVSSHLLIISALGFDLTQKNLFAPLISGGQLILRDMPHYDADRIRGFIEQHQITHINCAPSAFYPLMENRIEQLSSLRHVILGGEPIQATRFTDWLHNNTQCRLTNHYGPTECTDIALSYTIDNIDDFVKQDIPLGTPNDNVCVHIMNRFMQALPPGLTGELCISGAGVGLGYINNPAANAEKFISTSFGDTLYRTGDLVRQLADNDIVFVGRSDFQVKLNGLRIELGEIEHALKTQSDIDDALVLVNEQQLVAYVISTQSQLDFAHIKTQLSQLLPAYMVPTQFVSLTRWPLTANGKIDRAALPEPNQGNIKAAYVAPRDDIEQTICDIVSRVLNVSLVGVHDNFFDLGGHSLAASRAIVQIREHFAIDIPLSVLFDMTSAEKLANYIRAAQWATQSAESAAHNEGRDTGFI